jgi:hypothetical protein
MRLKTGVICVRGTGRYAALAQLVYRQVFAGVQIVYRPSTNAQWTFMKEISSCGCLQSE